MCSSRRTSWRGDKKGCCHVNTLASIWYGIFITILQAYIIVQTTNYLLEVGEEEWWETRAGWVAAGAACLGVPVLLAASLFKVGNLANDGYKLGRSMTTCRADPEDPLATADGPAALWRHGGPTAPFLHIFVAFSLLLPKLLIQPRLIKAGHLSKDNIWKTDIDFIISSYDRMAVFNFMPPSFENATFRPISMSQSGFFISPSPSPSIPSLYLSNLQASSDTWGTISIEFLNYALALAVYAVRYPAVFWNTNKCWGALFSFQLFINGIQILLIYIGVSVLYKVHVIGPSDILSSLPPRFGRSFFLLNPHVTLALFFLTTALVLSSSLVLYLYGYSRFNSFLSHEKACKVISVESKEWGYLTHCTALCVLLAITVVEGPLLVDMAIVYKSTLDMSVLLCVIGVVFHLFIWVVLWLGLTLKQNWKFKLRVTISKAAVKSAKSIKLLTDVELVNSCDVSAPLLVVASGRTYTVCDTSPKKTIIGAIHKAALERKAKLQASSGNREQEIEDNEEQIYWLRPKPISPKNSPDSEISDRVNWYRKPSCNKLKVTFDQSVTKVAAEDMMQHDEGDYARLRELPPALVVDGPMSNPCEMPLLSQHPPDIPQGTLRRHSHLINTNRDYEDPGPLLLPEPPELPPPPSNGEKPMTPRCLRRADSGMPNDLTPRSDSEASASPPDHSETSSGVHSNSSRESNHPGALKNGHSHEDISKQSCVQWKNQNPVVVNPPMETDLYIRRRIEAEMIALPSSPPDQFGRSTNMRMVSFTDTPSATLPHFPTQQIGISYPQCSTMPLPPLINPSPHCPNNYPRQHTTIPTHHNGVRLFNPTMFAKRFHLHRIQQHHSFPHLVNQNKFKTNVNEERDSANYSMASSDESHRYQS